MNTINNLSGARCCKSIPNQLHVRIRKERKHSVGILSVIIAVTVMAIAAMTYLLSPNKITYRLSNDGSSYAIYTGAVKDDDPSGRGTLKLFWKNGATSTYKGEFSEGKPHGKGVYIFCDGSKYYSDSWVCNVNQDNYGNSCFGMIDGLSGNLYGYFSRTDGVIGEYKNNAIFSVLLPNDYIPNGELTQCSYIFNNSE